MDELHHRARAGSWCAVVGVLQALRGSIRLSAMAVLVCLVLAPGQQALAQFNIPDFDIPDIDDICPNCDDLASQYGNQVYSSIGYRNYSSSVRAGSGTLNPWQVGIESNAFVGAQWDYDLNQNVSQVPGISLGLGFNSTGRVGTELSGSLSVGSVNADYAAEFNTRATFQGVDNGRRRYTINTDEVGGTAQLAAESSKLQFNLESTLVYQTSAGLDVTATLDPNIYIPAIRVDPNDYFSLPGWLRDLGVSESNVSSFTVPGTGTTLGISNPPSVTESYSLFDNDYSQTIVDINNATVELDGNEIDLLGAALGVPGGITDTSDANLNLDFRVPTVIGAAITAGVGAATGSVDNVFGDFSVGEMDFRSSRGDLELVAELGGANRSVGGARDDYEITLAQDLDGLAALKTQRPAEQSLLIPGLPGLTIDPINVNVGLGSIRIPYPCGAFLLDTCHRTYGIGSTNVQIFGGTTIPGTPDIVLDSELYDLDLLENFNITQDFEASAEVQVTYEFNQEVTVIADGIEHRGSSITLTRGTEFDVLLDEDAAASSLDVVARAAVDFDFEKDVAIEFEDVDLQASGPRFEINDSTIWDVGTADLDVADVDATLVSEQLSHSVTVANAAQEAMLFDVIDRLPVDYNGIINPGVVDFMSTGIGGVVANFNGLSNNPLNANTVSSMYIDYFEITEADVGGALQSVLGNESSNALAQLLAHPGFDSFNRRTQLWDVGINMEFVDEFVSLTFNYDDEGMAEWQERLLTILHFDEGEWVEMRGIVDMDANTITVLTDSFSPFLLSPVPEPGTMSLLALGLSGLAYRRRRRPQQH